MNYQIQTLNAISPAIYTQLGEHYHVSDSAGQPDAILVRSASMHDMPLAPSVPVSYTHLTLPTILRV